MRNPSSLSIIRIPFLVILLFILFLAKISFAESISIPSDMQQWVPWVLYNQEDKTCTLVTSSDNKKFCTWPSHLTMNVQADGAGFSQQWLIETRSLVPLPGNSPFWPEQVKADGENILIGQIDGHPAVWLEPGSHTITGRFSWESLPENIHVPPETGLVDLTVLGKEVSTLQLDPKGRLWLQHRSVKKTTAQDNLNIQVFRKIEDGVPIIEQVHILLTISGSPRPITLGLVTGSRFVLLEVQSPLPIRLGQDGRLNIQARPGQWKIQLKLRNTTVNPPERLTMGAINGPWANSEIWVFAADPKLRQLDIGGVLSVDPSRTSLPQGWKTLPAYLIKTGEEMILTEKNRGNPHPSPNRLTLHRKIWLDEKGTGLTVSDAISGTMTRGWRLNVIPSLMLGKVEVKGTPRLITTMQGSDKTGVEIRQGSLDLQADSRMERAVSHGKITLSALGWDQTFQNLSAELHLPPGWKLFTATGVDKVSTWLNQWTLLDLFLVLMIALATVRVLGWRWGVVALGTLVLSYHQPGAPKYLWLPLLALLGLQKLITARRGQRICRISGLLILLALIIHSVPYMINEIRIGIYPQLEHGKYYRVVEDFTTAPVAETMAQAIIDKSVAGKKSIMLSKSKITRGRSAYDQKVLPEYASKTKFLQMDPYDMIQTGPGLPDWHWETIPLSWNGPVTPDQKMSLYLLPPRVNTILAFLRVLLLTLLVGGFLRHCLGFGHKPINKGFAQTGVVGAVLLFCLCVGGLLPPEIHAEIPSPKMLQELQNRLLAPAKCGNHCVTINSCMIKVDKKILQMDLNLDAQIRSAIPLPGSNRFFDNIFLDDQPAAVLRLDDKGYSLIRVEAGAHTITLTKQLTGQNNLSVSFPIPPARGQADLHDWTLNGLRKNGLLEKQITLHKTSTTDESIKDRTIGGNSVYIPPFVRLERVLHMGLKWSVTTTVYRLSPKTVIALDIPLLSGERVTTGSLQVSNNHARINMGPEQNMLRFTSSMAPVEELILTAEKTSSWIETWFLDVSPIWHVDSAGIPEINQTNPAGKRFPEYHPYPGESLQLHIIRPKGVDGPVMTINRSRLIVHPGLHATENILDFALTASRGLKHTVKLPVDIDLQKTLIDDKEFPLQIDKGTLILPVHPGKQHIEIGWRSKQGIQKRFITEDVNLGVASVNTSIEMEVPSSRWILLTGGPRIGPAVLFWGVFLVIILLALILGRIRLTPLSSLQWLLLCLGLSQIPVPLATIVVGWLLLLGVRKNNGLENLKPAVFNAAQVVLALLTVAALACLFFAIQQGLLGHPDMQIGGNGSFHHTLRWYQDRSEALLPTAWVISVPLLAYRISMLIWALWLAMALLRWLRWGWDCYSTGGVWKKGTGKKKQRGNSKKSEIAPIEIV